MEFVLFMILFSSLAYSVEQGKKEWRHHRDTHARNIQQNNPDWHPRKVRRHARRRAVTWWTMETFKGFPAIRRAWREDRDHVKYLRETTRISSETRIEELRAELDAIRQGREEHEAAKNEGRTKLPFGTWYGEHAPRIRQGEPDPAAAVPATEPAERHPDDPPAVEETRSAAPPSALAEPGPAAPQASAPSAASDPAGDGSGILSDDNPGPITQELDAIVAGGLNPPARDTASAGTSGPSGELAGDSPYRAAFTALEQYGQAAEQHRQAAEVLEAQLTMHGFDRDPQLMQHVRGMQESATRISSGVASAQQTLTGNHSQGDEYHRSGVDADSSAFSNDG